MVEFEDLKKKYKIHEETESYFKQRAGMGLGSYMTAPSIEAARDINLQTAKKFGGEIEFEGTVKELTVPSAYDTGLLINLVTTNWHQSMPTSL